MDENEAVPQDQDEENVPPQAQELPFPFPWATEHNAKLRKLQYLVENGLTVISGKVFCESCGSVYVTPVRATDCHEQIETSLLERYFQHGEVAQMLCSKFISKFLPCQKCEYGEIAPVIPDDMDKINWMFLFCMEFLPYCSVQQLQHFCKQNDLPLPVKSEKSVLMWRVNREICRQMNPNGPFAD